MLFKESFNVSGCDGIFSKIRALRELSGGRDGALTTISGNVAASSDKGKNSSPRIRICMV
jgi:hypothetical protein